MVIDSWHREVADKYIWTNENCTEFTELFITSFQIFITRIKISDSWYLIIGIWYLKYLLMTHMTDVRFFLELTSSVFMCGCQSTITTYQTSTLPGIYSWPLIPHCPCLKVWGNISSSFNIELIKSIQIFLLSKLLLNEQCWVENYINCIRKPTKNMFSSHTFKC